MESLAWSPMTMRRGTNEGARRAIREFLESVHNDDRNSKARTLLVSGAPRSGKTQLAVETTLAGLRAGLAAGDDGSTVMLVPNRRVADLYSDRIIRELGSSERVRPATTLNALAFQLLEIARSRSGDSAPRLINGAEQDALLRHVIAVHVEQHRRGEDGSCETCRLLSAYFEDAGVQAPPGTEGGGCCCQLLVRRHARLGDHCDGCRRCQRCRRGDDCRYRSERQCRIHRPVARRVRPLRRGGGIVASRRDAADGGCAQCGGMDDAGRLPSCGIGGPRWRAPLVAVASGTRIEARVFRSGGPALPW